MLLKPSLRETKMENCRNHPLLKHPRSRSFGVRPAKVTPAVSHCSAWPAIAATAPWKRKRRPFFGHFIFPHSRVSSLRNHKWSVSLFFREILRTVSIAEANKECKDYAGNPSEEREQEDNHHRCASSVGNRQRGKDYTQEIPNNCNICIGWFWNKKENKIEGVLYSTPSISNHTVVPRR